MKNGDLPAMPLANGADGTPWLARDLGNPEQVIGLTKREDMAKHIMAALCVNNSLGWIDAHAAEVATQLTDKLLAELEK